MNLELISFDKRRKYDSEEQAVKITRWATSDKFDKMVDVCQYVEDSRDQSRDMSLFYILMIFDEVCALALDYPHFCDGQGIRARTFEERMKEVRTAKPDITSFLKDGEHISILRWMSEKRKELETDEREPEIAEH